MLATVLFCALLGADDRAPLCSTLSSGAGSIETKGTVRWDLRHKRWHYEYRLTNTSKDKTFFATWTLPTRAVGFGDSGFTWELKPGQTVGVAMLHDDPPVEAIGVIKIQDRRFHNGVKAWLSARTAAFIGETPTLHHQMGGQGSGYLPKSLAKKD
jgi:hypothetical protein